MYKYCFITDEQFDVEEAWRKAQRSDIVKLPGEFIPTHKGKYGYLGRVTGSDKMYFVMKRKRVGKKKDIIEKKMDLFEKLRKRYPKEYAKANLDIVKQQIKFLVGSHPDISGEKE